MSAASILVTGGAGYIGSHTVRQLGEAGARVVTLDDLSTGFRDAVLYGDFIEGDVADQALVTRILHQYSVDTVIHFAASTIVPESVMDPLRYYRNNTCATRNLLECCAAARVDHFVFSSSAAVYGSPDQAQCGEETPTRPINPYGMSKLMSEQMLRDLCAAKPMRHIILRYFNVAGSDPAGRIGQSTPGATLLIKAAVEHALGRRPALYIYGTDYPTPDGTGIRDYIHVEDLAAAHLQAVDYLRSGGPSDVLNCGYGHGYSVREVIDRVEQLHGAPLKVIEAARRTGDPAALIAVAERIGNVLGWIPAYDDLDLIVRHSLAWERRLMEQGR